MSSIFSSSPESTPSEPTRGGLHPTNHHSMHPHRRSASPAMDPELASSPSSQTPSLLDDPGLSDISSLDGEDFELVDHETESEQSDDDDDADDDTRLAASNATSSWVSGAGSGSGSLTPGAGQVLESSNTTIDKMSPSVNRLRQSYLAQSTTSVNDTDTQTPTAQSTHLEPTATVTTSSSPLRSLNDLTQSSFSFPDPNSPATKGLSPVESPSSSRVDVRRDGPKQDEPATTAAPAASSSEMDYHNKILLWLSQPGQSSSSTGRIEPGVANKKGKEPARDSKYKMPKAAHASTHAVLLQWLAAFVLGFGGALWYSNPALPLMAARSLSVIGWSHAPVPSAPSTSASAQAAAQTPVFPFVSTRLSKADWTSVKAVAVKSLSVKPSPPQPHRTPTTDVALTANRSTDVAVYYHQCMDVLAKPRDWLPPLRQAAHTVSQDIHSGKQRWVDDGFAFLKYGKDRIQAEARDEWQYWQDKLHSLWVNILLPFFEDFGAEAKRQHQYVVTKWEDIKQQHGPAFEEMRRATQLHMRRAAVGGAVLYGKAQAFGRDVGQEVEKSKVVQAAREAIKAGSEPVQKWMRDAARGAEVVMGKDRKRAQAAVDKRMASWKKRLETAQRRMARQEQREKRKKAGGSRQQKQQQQQQQKNRRRRAKWA